MEDLVANLVAIGVDEKKAQEAAKNKKLSAVMVEVLKEAGVPPCESTAGKLVYFAATKVRKRKIILLMSPRASG
eukprot:925268-Pyramimonas_sp.AAC.1